MAVEVWESHFDFQIHKTRVLHLGLPERGEVMCLCPLDSGAGSEAQRSNLKINTQRNINKIQSF